MQDFRNLKVWSKAHSLTLAAYRGTRSFPKSERYGLTSQIRRSAASVCANIAEGCGRGGKMEYHLILATDLKLFDGQTSEPLTSAVIEVKRMLAGLIRRL